MVLGCLISDLSLLMVLSIFLSNTEPLDDRGEGASMIKFFCLSIMILLTTELIFLHFREI